MRAEPALSMAAARRGAGSVLGVLGSTSALNYVAKICNPPEEEDQSSSISSGEEKDVGPPDPDGKAGIGGVAYRLVRELHFHRMLPNVLQADQGAV